MNVYVLVLAVRGGNPNKKCGKFDQVVTHDQIKCTTELDYFIGSFGFSFDLKLENKSAKGMKW